MSSSVRTRSRGALTPLANPQYYRQHGTCAETSWVLLATVAPTLVGTIETMNDTVIHKFAKRRAAGELFFNPMTYSKLTYESLGWTNWSLKSKATSCTSPLFYIENEMRGGSDLCRSLGAGLSSGGYTLPATTFVSQSDVNRLQGEVATSMFNQRGRSDVNLFETLAEADQTLDLFNRPIGRMTQLLKSAAKAKRDGKFIGYAVNGMSNLYLAYRYGIRPIIHDIEGIAEGLKKKVGEQRQTTRAKGGFEAFQTSTLTINWDQLILTVQKDITESFTVRAMNLDDVNLTYQDHLGFAPKGLITLPWELVSKSFVADWFLNIGDFIGAMVPAFGWKSLGRSMTTIHGVVCKYTVTNCVANPSSAYNMTAPLGGSYRASLLEKTRGPVSSPQIVVRNDFRFDKATRVADSLALIAQQMRTIFR